MTHVVNNDNLIRMAMAGYVSCVNGAVVHARNCFLDGDVKVDFCCVFENAWILCDGLAGEYFPYALRGEFCFDDWLFLGARHRFFVQPSEDELCRMVCDWLYEGHTVPMVARERLSGLPVYFRGYFAEHGLPGYFDTSKWGYTEVHNYISPYDFAKACCSFATLVKDGRLVNVFRADVLRLLGGDGFVNAVRFARFVSKLGYQCNYMDYIGEYLSGLGYFSCEVYSSGGLREVAATLCSDDEVWENLRDGGKFTPVYGGRLYGNVSIGVPAVYMLYDEPVRFRVGRGEWEAWCVKKGVPVTANYDVVVYECAERKWDYSKKFGLDGVVFDATMDEE